MGKSKKTCNISTVDQSSTMPHMAISVNLEGPAPDSRPEPPHAQDPSGLPQVETVPEAAGPRTSSREVSFSQYRVTDEANHLSLSMFDEMMMRFEAMSRDIKVQFDAMREDVRENRDRLNGIEHFVTQVPRSSCHAHMARDSIPQYPSRDSSAPQPMPHISSPVLVMPQSGIK